MTRVFLSYSELDRELARATSELLREQGMMVVDPFEMVASDDFPKRLLSELRTADCLVAFLSHRSPSVYYELGIAVGSGLPVLVVSAPSDLAPADLAALPFVQSTGDPVLDAQHVVSALKRFEDVAPRKEKGGPPTQDALAVAARDQGYLESLLPEEFEQVVRHWFIAQGLKVTSDEGNPFRGREGKPFRGYDFAVQYADDTLLVEVKKMSRQDRVSIDVVRRLIDALAASSAKRALLISSSGFTTAASALSESVAVLLVTLDDLVAARSLSELLERAAAKKTLQRTGFARR